MTPCAAREVLLDGVTKPVLERFSVEDQAEEAFRAKRAVSSRQCERDAVTMGALRMIHTHRHVRARVGRADLMVAAAAAAVTDAEARGAGGGLGATLVTAALATTVRLAVERAALRALAAALPSHRTPQS